MNSDEHPVYRRERDEQRVKALDEIRRGRSLWWKQNSETMNYLVREGLVRVVDHVGGFVRVRAPRFPRGTHTGGGY